MPGRYHRLGSCVADGCSGSRRHPDRRQPAPGGACAALRDFGDSSQRRLPNSGCSHRRKTTSCCPTTTETSPTPTETPTPSPIPKFDRGNPSSFCPSREYECECPPRYARKDREKGIRGRNRASEPEDWPPDLRGRR